MNIGMVLDNEFTGDTRVENEVIALQNAGFQVFVLCVNHGTKPNSENFHGATIIRFNISVFKKNKFKGLANTFFDLHTLYWSKKIESFIKDFNINVLHLHDLYMLPPGFRANKKLNLPIVGDLHENYAEALKGYKFTKTFPGKYIVSIPKWEKSEIEWIKKADFIITVIEEATFRYISAGALAEKIRVVPNYVNRTEFLKGQISSERSDNSIKKFVITYVGGFDIHRGLESVIEAMPALKLKIPNIELLLIGDGRNMQDLQDLAKKLNVSEHVEFAGRQPASSIPNYIVDSDICLIPHLKSVHTDNTIPHKLFQYMLMKRPVISTNCNPLKRIIDEIMCGLVYESGNSNDLAEKVFKLYSDKNLTKLMSENGYIAVKDIYNWDKASETLTNLYKFIQKGNRNE